MAKFEFENNGKSILEEAEDLVRNYRGQEYGHPCQDFTRTAKLWSVLKDVEFSPQDVAKFMICLKLSRETNKPKRDNRVDVAGYVLTLDMIEELNEN